MQMFGVGILEIMVILTLAVLVVGPERLPQVSAELAQWIRRGRAYARHLGLNEGDTRRQAKAATQSDLAVGTICAEDDPCVGRPLVRSIVPKAHRCPGPIRSKRIEPHSKMKLGPGSPGAVSPVADEVAPFHNQVWILELDPALLTPRLQVHESHPVYRCLIREGSHHPLESGRNNQRTPGRVEVLAPL